MQEYWIVDTKYTKVIVYEFEGDIRLTEYSFHDRIPVGISGGKCEIDFEIIFEKIRRFYDKEEKLLPGSEEDERE